MLTLFITLLLWQVFLVCNQELTTPNGTQRTSFHAKTMETRRNTSTQGDTFRTARGYAQIMRTNKCPPLPHGCLGTNSREFTVKHCSLPLDYSQPHEASASAQGDGWGMYRGREAAVGNRETQKSTTAAKLTYSGRASLLAPNNKGWEGLSLIPSSPQSKRPLLLPPDNTEWEREAERPSRIPSNSQEFQGQKVIPAAWKSLRES